jgi:hypothetical protein
MRCGWVVSLLFASAIASGFAAEKIQLPDPRTGEIAGHKAALVWPARLKSWDNRELIAPDGCSVHLVPGDDLEAETTFPCGRWFRAAPNRYRAWLESNDSISPFPIVLQWSDSLFDGAGLQTVAPVVPAARVRLADGIVVPPAAGFRLMSLNDEFLGVRMRAFDRRVARTQRVAAVPAGKAMAGLFDRTTNDALALTHPLDAPAGATATARPLPPKQSDVLVLLERPIGEKTFDVSLRLEDAKGPRPPDVFVQASDRVAAVWYEASGRSARLTAESAVLRLEPVTLVLRPQRVTTLRGALQRLPRLSATVRAPHGAFKKLEISVRRRDASAEVARKEVGTDGVVHFDGVPAAPLRVTLTADQWQLPKEIDLRDGRDGDVDFDLKPIAIHGTLFLGSSPAPGTLTFELANKTMQVVDVAADGTYEAVLWRPSTYVVHVKPRSDPFAFIDPAVDIETNRQLDFHVPNNRVTVRVTDARSGRGIPHARVTTSSISADPLRGEMTLSYPYDAGDDGVAVLPRTRTGRLVIDAEAAGYTRSEPREFAIGETTEKEIAIALRKQDAASTARVMHPGGLPASGAEALLIGADGQPLWRGSAGAGGELDLPAAPADAVLVVRHPDAASKAWRFPLPDVIALAPRAAEPRSVHSVNAAGDVVPFAVVTFWLDGARLTGSALAFAAWSNATMTDNHGVWLGRNLPPGPLRILLSRNVAPAQLASGAYDALSTVVSNGDVRVVIAR